MMSFFRRVLPVWAILLTLSLLIVTPTLAMGPAQGVARHPMPLLPNPGFGEGIYAEVDYAAAAKALGMEVDALKAELWAGTTLAALADKAGVEVTVLQTAVDAARYQALTEGLSPANASSATLGATWRTTAWRGLNLRTGPGLGYGIWTTVPYGTIVHAAGATGTDAPYGWTEIVYQGRTLWAYAAYLAPAW